MLINSSNITVANIDEITTLEHDFGATRARYVKFVFVENGEQTASLYFLDFSPGFPTMIKTWMIDVTSGGSDNTGDLEDCAGATESMMLLSNTGCNYTSAQLSSQKLNFVLQKCKTGEVDSSGKNISVYVKSAPHPTEVDSVVIERNYFSSGLRSGYTDDVWGCGTKRPCTGSTNRFEVNGINKYIGYEFQWPFEATKMEIDQYARSDSLGDVGSQDESRWYKHPGDCGTTREDYVNSEGYEVKNYCNHRGSDRTATICYSIEIEYAELRSGPFTSVGNFPGQTGFNTFAWRSVGAHRVWRARCTDNTASNWQFWNGGIHLYRLRKDDIDFDLQWEIDRTVSVGWKEDGYNHVALTRDGSKFSTFLNGQKVQEDSMEEDVLVYDYRNNASKPSIVLSAYTPTWSEQHFIFGNKVQLTTRDTRHHWANQMHEIESTMTFSGTTLESSPQVNYIRFAGTSFATLGK